MCRCRWLANDHPQFLYLLLLVFAAYGAAGNYVKDGHERSHHPGANHRDTRGMAALRPDTGALVWARSRALRSQQEPSQGQSRGIRTCPRCRRAIPGASDRLGHAHRRLAKGDIDHINGKRDDNRIANLRDVPRAVNRQNVLAHAPITASV